VELDELDVGHDGARAQRDGHPVAGRDGRVGRGGVELAEPAGREDDGPSVSGADSVDLALADDVDRHAAYPAVGGLEQVHDERVLDHLDARVARQHRPGIGRDEADVRPACRLPGENLARPQACERHGQARSAALFSGVTLRPSWPYIMPIAIHRKANSGVGRRLEPAKPVTKKHSRPATAPW